MPHVLRKEMSMATASNIFLTTLLLSASIFSNSALASACYEPSPNLDDQEQDYYNLEDTVKLSNTQKNQLQRLLGSLTGKWEGHSYYIECRGPDRAPRTVVSNTGIKAKTNLTSSIRLSVNAEKHYIQKRIKKSDNFTLPNLKNVYHFEFTGKNTLLFSEKYRRSNTLNTKPIKAKASSNATTIVDKVRNSGPTTYKVIRTKKKLSSRLAETIYEVTFTNNSLTLTRSYYNNGAYIGEELWRLNRR